MSDAKNNILQRLRGEKPKAGIRRIPFCERPAEARNGEGSETLAKAFPAKQATVQKG